MYDYGAMKPELFTEKGIEQILDALSNAQKLLPLAGVVKASKLWPCGDTWLSMAAVDFLVHKGYLRQVAIRAAAQDQMYVTGPQWGERTS